MRIARTRSGVHYSNVFTVLDFVLFKNIKELSMIVEV